MSALVAIREGGVDDLPAVFDIADAWLGQPASAWVGGKPRPYYQTNEARARVRQDLQKGARWLLVAEREGLVVGFAVYGMEEQVAFINLVMVSPAAQNQRVATALVRAVVDEHDHVGAWNDVGPEMRGLYEKLGFRCTDRVQTGQYKAWEFRRGA